MMMIKKSCTSESESVKLMVRLADAAAAANEQGGQ